MGPCRAGPENIRSSNILSTSATSMVTRNLKTLGIHSRGTLTSVTRSHTPRRSSECRSGWTGTPVVRTPRPRAGASPPAPPALPATGSRLPSSAIETRAELIGMCRKRPFATDGQYRLPARAAVCRIPCLILCLADVERVCQCRAPNAPCGVHGRMVSVIRDAGMIREAFLEPPCANNL